MGLQTWQETLQVQQAAASNFASYTTAKTVISPQALYTLRSNFFSVGKRLRITVHGALSNIVTTPGTITFQVMIGGVIAFTTGAIQFTTTAHTLLPFILTIDLTCRSIGNSTNTTLMGQAKVEGIMFTPTSGADGTATHATVLAPATAPAVGTGFDSTIDNILDFFAGLSINNSGNNITVQQYTVEALN